MAATTFRVLLVGSGWLSSRRTAPSLLVSSASTAGTRRMERGAKILGLPFSATPRHRSFLTPVPTYAHFTHGATTRPDIPRRLLSPAPVVLSLCVGHVCGAELFLIRRTLLLSALLCSANRRQGQNVCVSHPQHHPWIDASIPAKSTRPHRAFLLAIYDPMMMPYANANASFFLPM